ncbi:hypothetical protein Vafri_20393, partial [Volvox africanus]
PQVASAADNDASAGLGSSQVLLTKLQPQMALRADVPSQRQLVVQALERNGDATAEADAKAQPWPIWDTQQQLGTVAARGHGGDSAPSSSKEIWPCELFTSTLWLTAEMCEGGGVFGALLDSGPSRERITLVSGEDGAGDLRWKVVIVYDEIYCKYEVHPMARIFKHFRAKPGDEICFCRIQACEPTFGVSVLRQVG